MDNSLTSKDKSHKKKCAVVYCFVPMCPSNSIKFPDKRFLTVPQEPNRREKWMKVARKQYSPSSKSVLRCCEDHFDIENDMENYIKYKLVGGMLKLKKDVVPHKFECQIKRSEVKERISGRKRLKKDKIVDESLHDDIDDLPTTSNNAIEEIFVDQSSPHKTVNEDPFESLEINYEVNPEPLIAEKSIKKIQVMEEAKKPSYKHCMVPQCKNNVRNTPDKMFFRIPSDAKVRKEWCKMMGRDNVSRILCLYCCEDHFNVKEDTDNYFEYNEMKQQGKKCNLRLKKGVVPHLFLGHKRNMSPPVEETFLVKRQRLPRVNKARSEIAIKSSNDPPQRSDNEIMTEAEKPFNKYCLVPQCKNTVRSTPDKVFFRLPSDAKLRKHWCKIMKTEYVSPKSCLYCCEDHFNVKEDTANYFEYKTMKHQGDEWRLRLKKGVVPHIFGRKRISPPIEDMELVKRQRLALVNEALSEFASKSNNDPPHGSDYELPNDMENYMEYHVMGSVSQVRMKLGCMPTKFICQPDRITRTSDTTELPYIAKKRRTLQECEKHFEEKCIVTEQPSSEGIASVQQNVEEVPQVTPAVLNKSIQRDEPVDPLRQPDDDTSREAGGDSSRQVDDDSNPSNIASSSTDTCYSIKFEPAEPEEMEEYDESPDSFPVRGLVPPVFTPMNEDGSINFSLIPSYAKYLADSGIKAVLVGGTTGENMSLRVGDRMKLVDWWLEAAKDTDLHIMVQVGGAPLADVLTLAQYCQKAGAHSLLTLPELYFKPQTVEELVSYVQLVADAAPRLPVLYYHIPSMSKVEINMPKFVTAATERIPNFKGIKFTSNDLSEAAQVLRSLEKGQEIFLGADTLIAPAALLGIKSSIGTSFNLLPALAQQILQAVELNQVARARHLQEKLSLAIEAHTCEGPWVPIMKAGMELLTGIMVGPPSLPQQPISDEAKARIAAKLSELGMAEYVRSYNTSQS